MRSKTKKISAVILIIIAVLLFIAVYFLQESQEIIDTVDFSGKNIDYYLKSDTDGKNDSDDNSIKYEGEWYTLKSDVEAYLLMGIDKDKAEDSGSYNDGGQADVLILFVIDNGEKSYSFIQINRDTMTDVEILGVMGDVVGTTYEQIAAAHFYGNGLANSCNNTVRAVSNFLYGIKINGYASVGMDSIPIINDDVGGVTVTVNDDFSNVDSTLVLGETVTLNGSQAYNYVRSRKNVGEETNIERMDRHREYFAGLLESFEKVRKENGNLITKIFNDLNPYLVTDLSLKDVINLSEETQNYVNNGIITIDGEAKVGDKFMEFYADDNSVKEIIVSLFYKKKDN